MRSLHLLALATAITAAGAACGGDGNGNGNGNEDPVADFTFACTLLNCTFTDASTDDSDVASWSWNFDDGTPPVTTQNATHAFAAAGTYDVALTVTDDEGADASVTKQVVVSTTPPVNQPPVPSFTVSCSSGECDFTNTSTDADGTIVSYAWNFGDPSSGANNTATTEDASHTYTVTDELTTFTVSLTVTDDDGASAGTTNDVTVSPPATLTCGATPDCSLLIEVPSTVTVTLVSSDCELSGNTFKITEPLEEILFTDGCNTPDGTQFPLQGGAVIGAGTEIKAQVISGGTTLEIPPAVTVEGTFATGWTLRYDDGAIAGTPTNGEPDFNDLIITIVATPQ